MGRKTKPTKAPNENEILNTGEELIIGASDEIELPEEMVEAEEVIELPIAEEIIEMPIREEVVEPEVLSNVEITNISSTSIRLILADGSNTKIPFREKIKIPVELISENINKAKAENKIIVMLSKGE